MRLCLLITVIVCGAFGAAELCAQVVRTSQTAMPGYAVRAGHWIPIQVQLSAQGTTPFQGQLRLEAPDLDGDLVSYREGPVALNFEAGAKRAWCYAVWSHRTGAAARPVTLDVLTDAGLPVSELNVPDVEVINNDALLLLDISNQPVTRLRGALLTPGGTLERGDGVRPFYRDIVVAAMPAGDLPERWFGLEAVDIIVWINPLRPTRRSRRNWTHCSSGCAAADSSSLAWARAGRWFRRAAWQSSCPCNPAGAAEGRRSRPTGSTSSSGALEQARKRRRGNACSAHRFRWPPSRPGPAQCMLRPVADGPVDLIAALDQFEA